MTADTEQIAEGVSQIADKRVQEATTASVMSRFHSTMTIALIAIVVMLSVALGLIYGEVSSINHTVTSHNGLLQQTLHAACILIKSDPKLPLPKGCLPS